MTQWKHPKLIAAAAVSIVVLVAAVRVNQPESNASTQTTEDAYVQADFTTVGAEVSGTVSRVLVADHQRVSRGELLATIDDRGFAIAVDAAKSQVARAEADLASLVARLQQQETAIRQARAAIAADDAGLELARSNEARYRNLADDGAGSVQQLQQAESQLRIQRAARSRSVAGLEAAKQQVAVLEAELERARATLAQARSALAAAELDLSRTRITAPIGGTIGQHSVRVGAFVSAGKPLLVIVPLDALYVTANFRETQLARVEPGQRVSLIVDALPGSPLKGVVQSLGPASGIAYAAIAPRNASGNFTKIVQRLPVRIRIEPGQPDARRLRVGMSVVPTIRVGE